MIYLYFKKFLDKMQSGRFTYSQGNLIPQFSVNDYYPCVNTFGVVCKHDGKENKILRHFSNMN